MAVRVYYAHNLPPSISSTQAWSEIMSRQDLDGLERFQQSFALSIVFFVLNDQDKDRHLAEMGSFVRRAMHRLTTSTFRSSSSKSSSSSTTTRVLIVSSSEAAVQALATFADALAPGKKLQDKQEFYMMQRQTNYLPPLGSGISDPSTLENTAAAFALRALRQWAFRNNVPEHEMDICIKVLGNLEAVVAHSATGLDGVPIAHRTKMLLQHFFHGDASDVAAGAGTQNGGNHHGPPTSTAPFEMAPQGFPPSHPSEPYQNSYSQQQQQYYPQQQQQQYQPQPQYHSQHHQQPGNYWMPGTTASSVPNDSSNFAHSSFASLQRDNNGYGTTNDWYMPDGGPVLPNSGQRYPHQQQFYR